MGEPVAQRRASTCEDQKKHASRLSEPKWTSFRKSTINHYSYEKWPLAKGKASIQVTKLAADPCSN